MATPLGLVVYLTMRWKRDNGKFTADVRKEYGFFFQNYNLGDTGGGSSADEGASEARMDPTQDSSTLCANRTPASMWRAYWELVITLRKVAIAVVVVFAYRLGGSLQAAVALLVVFVALVLHLAAQPYKRERFNRLESASLVVSVVTFHAALVFNDENASEGGKVTLAVVVYLLHVALMAAFAAQLACSSRPWWSRQRGVARSWACSAVGDCAPTTETS